MTWRIIGASLVLCTATGLMVWGLEQARSAFSGAAPAADDRAAGDAQEQPALVPVPERGLPQRARAVPRRHLTETEDIASIKAIRAESTAMFAEYNARHAEAFAGRFLPAAEYEIETGEVLIGREAIQEHFRKLFEESPEGRIHSHDSSIRTISLNLAIEDGVVAITHSADDEESESPYIAIWTFVDGRWYVASVREFPAPPDEDAREHLLELAWLVGDWIDETEDAVVTSSCYWSDDGNFLIQDFSVHVLGSPVVTGTQRIGFDPRTRNFRSWVFDSHGGFGDDVWNWDGEKYVIRSSAVRHDGRTAASLNFIIPDTQDSYYWESSHRMSDGENLPDLRVKIVRQAPPPGSDEVPADEATTVGASQ